MASNYVIRGTADMSQHDNQIRKSASEIFKYKTQVKNAKQELTGLNKNMNASSQSLNRFMGSLNNGNLSSMVTSLGGLSSAFGSLGGNIGGLTSSLGALGGNITALVNPYVAVSAAVVGAGVAFYNFNKNLDTTTRKVQEFLGVSRNVAIPIRNEIQAIADTYNVEFKDVLNSVDVLMVQFGVDANRALDIVSDGFAAGANENGNFLSLLQQYAPTFQDAGIGARELASYIAQTRSGIFNEDGLRLIAVAAKNIRNMSKSTKESLRAIGIDADDMIEKLNNGQITIGQAISTISSKLGQLNPQSQQVGAVLQDVFGKKGSEAGYKLVTSLANIETDLDKVKQQTGEWGTAMDELREANDRMNNALAEMFGTANGGFDLLTTKVKSEVIGAFASLLETLNKYPNVFRNIMSMGTGALGVILNNVINIKKIISWIEGKTGDFKMPSGGVGGVVGAMAGGVSNLSNPQTTTIPTDLKTPKGGGKKSSGKSTPSVPRGIEAPTLTLGVNIDKSELNNATEQWVNSLPSQLEEVKNKYAKIFENTNAQSLMENNTAFFEMFTDEIYKQAEAFGYYSSILGSVSQALGVLGDSAAAQAVQFGVNTAAILANAAKEIIAMNALAQASGAANAFKLPFPANLAAWAVVASTIASIFSSLPSFAEGGIFSGNRTIGDMNLARVNSGEMILNGKQQRNLFNLINSGALSSGSDSNQTVHFRVSGNDLVGVLNNFNNKRNKVK